MASVFLNYTQEELDRAYDQRAWAANADDLIAHYAATSAEVRSRHAFYTHLPYGSGANEAIDWFGTEARGGPVHIHLHGGAWRALSKAHASFAAPAFTTRGIHYVVADFTNLPVVRMPHMVDQLVRAVAFIHRNAERFGGNPQAMTISGHSSGAHLCAVLLARDWTADGLPADVLKAGLCISGIYDLEPVMASSRRTYVDLTSEETAALSPVRHAAKIACPLVLAYGEKESPEFIRQARHFLEVLDTCGRSARVLVEPDANHFEIALDLGRTGTPIFEAAAAQAERAAGSALNG